MEIEPEEVSGGEGPLSPRPSGLAASSAEGPHPLDGHRTRICRLCRAFAPINVPGLRSLCSGIVALVHMANGLRPLDTERRELAERVQTTLNAVVVMRVG
eukprot:15004515-Alexandrium_andersonii.AAC.1